jgi:hypothetical protein
MLTASRQGSTRWRPGNPDAPKPIIDEVGWSTRTAADFARESVEQAAAARRAAVSFDDDN